MRKKGKRNTKRSTFPHPLLPGVPTFVDVCENPKLAGALPRHTTVFYLRWVSEVTLALASRLQEHALHDDTQRLKKIETGGGTDR